MLEEERKEKGQILPHPRLKLEPFQGALKNSFPIHILVLLKQSHECQHWPDLREDETAGLTMG